MTEPSRPSLAYAWYVVAILMLVTLSSLIDRQAPNLLVQPLRNQLGLSDTQISILQGPAFAVVYSFLGLPFGWLTDRRNRRTLIAAGVIFYSATTILCGFAGSFWQFFLARMGVGIGEAVLAPAAYSLIADYFNPRMRGLALGVYFSSLSAGSGIAVMVVGLLLRFLSRNPSIAIPLLGVFAPWQVTLITAGMAGLVLVGFLLTVREVPRRNNKGATDTASTAHLHDFLMHLRRHWWTFLSVHLSYAMVGLIGLALFSWAPTFYIRNFGLSVGQVGLVLGTLLTCAGLAGALCSGLLSDRWASNNFGGRYRLAPLSFMACLPALTLWPLVHNLDASIALFGVAAVTVAIGTASGAAVVQDIVPTRMRGQSMALFLLVVGLSAYALGPMSVALLTDYVFMDVHKLGWSLVIVTVPTALLGCLIAMAAMKSYSLTRNEVLEL